MKPGIVQLNYERAEVLHKTLGDSQGILAQGGLDSKRCGSRFENKKQ